MHSLEIALIRSRKHPLIYYVCDEPIADLMEALKTICVNYQIEFSFPIGTAALDIGWGSRIQFVDSDQPLPHINAKIIVQQHRTPTKNDRTKWRTLKSNMMSS